jgi:hypothetical protein
MKKLLFLLPLLAFAVSAFAQTSVSAKLEIPIKHDTVNVVVRQYYDTIKVNIYYEDKSYIRVTQGFEIRKIETKQMQNQAQPTGTIMDVRLYDDKWRKFTKTLFTIQQILTQ